MTTPISNPSEILEFNEYIDVINHFIDSGWTDGLPIIPPTQELVDLVMGLNAVYAGATGMHYVVKNGF